MFNFVFSILSSILGQLGPNYDPLFYDVMIYLFGIVIFSAIVVAIVIIVLKKKKRKSPQYGSSSIDNLYKDKDSDEM